MTQFRGSMTTSDGKRVQLSPEEAKAVWEAVERQGEERAKRLPDTKSALASLIDAEERLKELGWRSARYCPRDGSEFAVCEIGSTGMWRAFYASDYIHYADCVSNGDRMYFKPLDKLNEEELALVAKCDKAVADLISSMGDHFA